MDIFESIVTLLIGSAVFITGMNMMSGGLKKVAGKGLKSLLKKIQNNRFAGFGIGAVVTALIQSSAATSVMAIGFISAGVMSIFQGTAIILGACVGTTVTGLLASLSSFNIDNYFFLLAFIGLVMMYFSNEKVKYIGEICCGLGLLFFGLFTMKKAFGSVSDPTPVYNFFQKLFTEVKFPILLVIIGAIFTALVQSSSATAGIVIVMVGSDAITLGSGFYLVIGATIGTVITTLIATIGGNQDVKRTGLIALMFKVVSAALGLAIIWPLENQIVNLFIKIFPNTQLALAMFLMIYSAVFYMAMLPFIEQYVKLSRIIIKDKEEPKVKGAIKYIDNRLLNTPTIAMMQVKKEIISMMQMSYENLKLAYSRIKTQDSSQDRAINETEDKIDFINQQITLFLISLSQKVDSVTDEKKVGGYFHVINDIERIGDHAVNFLELSQKMQEEELQFSEIAFQELDNMFSVVQNMCELVIPIFESEEIKELSHLHVMEDETDRLKQVLTDAHFSRVSTNQCTIELSPFYSSLISGLERVADHLVNVGYSILNPTGAEDEVLDD